MIVDALALASKALKLESIPSSCYDNVTKRGLVVGYSE